MIALALVLASVTPPLIDVSTVQSAAVYELNVDAVTCPAVLVKGAVCAQAGRHYELNPGERARIVSLLNDPASFAPGRRPSCKTPREAVVLETTKGRVAYEFNLECNDVAGKVPTKKTRFALSQFLRGFGFIAHVPVLAE